MLQEKKIERICVLLLSNSSLAPSFISSPRSYFSVCVRHYLSVVRGQSKDNTVNTDGSWAAALPSDIDALFVAASRLASALAVRGPAVHGPETANSAATNAEANQGSSNMCRWPLAACHNDLVLQRTK
jgi:hypothetical protein